MNIHEAKTHLSRLIQRALAGEEVIIARDNTPLVRLEVLDSVRGNRRIGGVPDFVVAMADDFDAPLSDFEAYMP